MRRKEKRNKMKGKNKSVYKRKEREEARRMEKGGGNVYRKGKEDEVREQQSFWPP